MPLEQFHQPTPQFSYLGVPAAPGMSDCYESMPRTPIRDALKWLSSAPATPQFVIPAKAGIHALTSRERTPTAIPPPTSTRRPHFVFPATARPEPRDTGPESRERMGAMALERCRRLTHSILILCCAGGIRQRRYVGNFEGLANRQRSPASLIDRHDTLGSRSKRIRPCPASCWSPRTWQSLISRSASLVRVDTHMRRC